MIRHLPSWFAIILVTSTVWAAEPDQYPAPGPNSAEEPLAKVLSLEKAGTFLDRAVFAWTREQNCGSCHTSYPYLMARPAIGDAKAPALLEMRSFFEKRIAK